MSKVEMKNQMTGQMTGMLGVYLTAVELTKRNLIVSPTSRSAKGADLLVTDCHCQRAWSVQVKTNRGRAKFWLMGAHTEQIASANHVYVFVNAATKETPEFYVVPSEVVASTVRTVRSSTGSIWYEYHRDEVYQDNWELFNIAEPMK